MHFWIFHLIYFLAIIDQSITAVWNYGDQGPDVWSDTYPSCAGRSQSPIDIRTACTVYQSFEPFQFSSTYDQAQDFTLINTGHTVSGTLTNGDSSPLTLTGGGLEGTYKFSSFHFHWGENYKSGSEHQVNNEKYTGELHLIHTNPTTKQIAVLGIFLESDKEANNSQTGKRKKRASQNSAGWGSLFSSADDLEKINESTTVNLNLASLIAIDFTQFWRYTGSLTTPPCTEGLIWTVFKQPIIINENQLAFLRNDLYPKDYREPQLLHHRMVYRSFRHETLPATAEYLCCLRDNA